MDFKIAPMSLSSFDIREGFGSSSSPEFPFLSRKCLTLAHPAQDIVTSKAKSEDIIRGY
ncbi:hypothetical protein Vi05172_g6313 [Venturia inaequalis]|nr:hypothetical protein Vi05172_g6313 [Venturia inaequalis]